MKYCSNCGNQLDDNAYVCPKCGCLAGYTPQQQSNSTTMKTVTKIFMVLGCVLSAFYFLIPLCWTIPMTITYFSKVDKNEPIGVGFKVCTLLFVSLIAGILMLCDNNNGMNN